MTPQDIYQAAHALIDWVPDTIWDTVLAMLGLYSLVLLAGFEFSLWLDRRERRR